MAAQFAVGCSGACMIIVVVAMEADRVMKVSIYEAAGLESQPWAG